jgi:two-component system, LytTR family, response regulator
MNQLNILIIEDTKEDSDALVEILEENGYTIVGVASNYLDALTLFHAHPVDLAVIDIFLNGHPEGILFAETITTVPNSLRPFVFLTSSRDRQLFERAKLTKPFSFLSKPFNKLDVLYAIEMAIEKFYSQPLALNGSTNVVSTNDFLFVKKKNNLQKVSFSLIEYIEVEERYCSIYVAEEKYVVQLSLSKMESYLPSDFFKRTHRNYIVNTQFIQSIDTVDNLIYLKGGQMVPLSETYKDFIRFFQVLR